MEKIGELIWQTVRGFQEAHLLLEHLGHHMQNFGDSTSAERFLTKASELNKRASTFQRVAVGHETLSSHTLEQERSEDRS